MADNQPVDILAVAAGNPAQAVPGQKREYAMVGGTVDRNKKKRNKKPKVSQGPVIPKNALMQLNEIKPGLVYNVGDHEGPVHNPVFRCTVEVNGQMFEGKGVSKKKAKLDAAEKALNSFVQLPSSTATTTPAAESGDFMSDQGEGSGFSNFDEAKKDTNGTSTSGLPNVPMGGIPLEKPQNKSPVMVLNELKPGTQYSFVSESGEHHSKSFTMEVVVNDKKFQGEGRSKKLAKARAAQLALKECFNIDFDTQPGAGQSLQSFGGNEQAWKQYKQATQETQSLPTGEKNSIQQLNELYSQIQFVCDEPTGPLLNARLFRVSVRVEGQNYEGMANNKKTAKLAAANAAMEGLRVSGLLQARQAELEGNRQMRQEKQRDVIKRLKENGKFFPNRQKEERVVEYEYSGPANPCTRLGDFHADPQYKIVGQLGEHPDAVFTVQCIVKGISYMGCGRTKRDGKYNAAEKALRSLGLWTQEDEELKLYRETHDGKNPTTQQRRTIVRRHKDSSAGEFQPTDRADKPDKAFGFKKGGNQTSRWGGPKRGGGGGGGRGGGGGGNQRAGAANAGFNRVGSKDGFKSVLSSQWTQFKKGGTLGSGLVFEDGTSGGGTGGGTNQGNKGGAKKITGGTQSMAQQPPAQQEDFTVDSYSFDTQPASSLNTQSYGYGYGNQTTGQQQQEAYFTTGSYAESYQNPAYGYGYDQYSSTGMNQYAQQY